MKNVLFWLGIAALVVFGGTRVLRALESDEEAIARRLSTMAAGFNETSRRRALGGFHNAYRDEGTGSDKQTVSRALAYMFFSEKDPVAGGFRYRVELDEDALVVELDEDDPERAEFTLHALFYERAGERRELWWDARVRGEMRKDSGSWRVYRTRDVNHDARGE